MTATSHHVRSDAGPPPDLARTERPSVNNPKVFWVGVAIGGLVLAYGLRGLFQHSDDTNPAGTAKMILGLNLAHDLILAPLVIAIGAGVTRILPRRFRPVVGGGLLASGVVVLFALPLVLGYGRIPATPSVLPRNYAHGLLAVLAAVWLVTLAVLAGVVVRGRRRSQPDAQTGPDVTNWRV